MAMKYLGLAVACAVGLGAMVASTTSADAQYSGKKYTKGAPVVQSHRAGPQHYSGGHRRSNTGRNVAAGVAAAVIGGIIINEVARGNSSGDGLSCRQLERRCDDGQDWACAKYDRRGC